MLSISPTTSFATASEELLHKLKRTNGQSRPCISWADAVVSNESRDHHTSRLGTRVSLQHTTPTHWGACCLVLAFCPRLNENIKSCPICSFDCLKKCVSLVCFTLSASVLSSWLFRLWPVFLSVPDREHFLVKKLFGGERRHKKLVVSVLVVWFFSASLFLSHPLPLSQSCTRQSWRPSLL